jgi:hypothetical protein
MNGTRRRGFLPQPVALTIAFALVLAARPSWAAPQNFTLADLPFSVTIPEPANEGAENVSNIVITNARFVDSAQGDVVLSDPGMLQQSIRDVTGGFTYATSSDLIRFINVNGVANIFFISSPIGDITAIPGPFSLNPIFQEETTPAIVVKLLVGAENNRIQATLVSDLNPNGGVPSDAVRLEWAPEPSSLYLLSAGILGVLAYSRRRRNC